MSKRTLLGIGALMGALLLPSPSLANPAATQPCPLSAYEITSVAPYRVSKQIGRAAVKQHLGAKVFVRARPGLTSEWLEASLSEHLRTMHGETEHGDCALDLDGVQVEVGSAGPGFVVRISARNPNQAKEVLRRARLLVA